MIDHILRVSTEPLTEADVEPKNPRLKGHSPWFAENEWYSVSDELAQTVSLGPAGGG